MSTEDELPEYLTTGEVARYLRVSEVTVRYWRRIGKLASTKLGRFHRFKRVDVLNKVKKQKLDNTTTPKE